MRNIQETYGNLPSNRGQHHWSLRCRAINGSSDSMFFPDLQKIIKTINIRQATYSNIKGCNSAVFSTLTCIGNARRQDVSAPFLFSKTGLTGLLAPFFTQRQNVGCLDRFGSHRKVKVSAITSISSPFCIFGICCFASFQSLTAKL